MRQMLLERATQAPRQHCHAVFSAFAVAHNNPGVTEINVFYAQPDAFHQTEATPVKQAGHKSVCPRQVFEQLANFILGEYDGKAGRSFRPLHLVQPADFLF